MKSCKYIIDSPVDTAHVGKWCCTNCPFRTHRTQIELYFIPRKEKQKGKYGVFKYLLAPLWYILKTTWYYVWSVLPSTSLSCWVNSCSVSLWRCTFRRSGCRKGQAAAEVSLLHIKAVPVKVRLWNAHFSLPCSASYPRSWLPLWDQKWSRGHRLMRYEMPHKLHNFSRKKKKKLLLKRVKEMQLNHSY